MFPFSPAFPLTEVLRDPGVRELEAQLREQSDVSLWNITSIDRNTILRRTGGLTEDEMLAISEKLISVLETDVSERLRKLRDL